MFAHTIKNITGYHLSQTKMLLEKVKPDPADTTAMEYFYNLLAGKLHTDVETAQKIHEAYLEKHQVAFS